VDKQGEIIIELPFMTSAHDAFYHKNVVGNQCTRMRGRVYVGRTIDVIHTLYNPCPECVKSARSSKEETR